MIMLCLYFCLKSHIMHMVLLKWFLILKEEKRCLFCWGAVNLPWAHQSLLAAGVQSKMAYTHAHRDILTAPPVVRAGKTSMPNVMFQSLCQEWSVWILHWASLIFSLCHCSASCAGGPYLLSQHGDVKPGHNQSEVKPMGHIWEFNRYVGRESNLSVGQAKESTPSPSFRQSKVHQFAVTAPFV